METPERKRYRREWARAAYRANPERYRKARADSYQKESAEKREARRAAGKVWREKNKDHLRALNAKWREKNKARTRDNNLRRIGWSSALFDLRLAEQDNLCAVCSLDLLTVPSKQRHADHCHTTQKPRGVLCHHCNAALGLAKEDPSVLRALLAYLEKWTKENCDGPTV